MFESVKHWFVCVHNCLHLSIISNTIEPQLQEDWNIPYLVERSKCSLRLSTMYLQWVSDNHCAEKSDSEDMEMWPLPSPAFEMLNRSNSQLLTSPKKPKIFIYLWQAKILYPVLLNWAMGKNLKCWARKKKLEKDYSSHYNSYLICCGT